MKAETKQARIAAMFGLEAPKKPSPRELRRSAHVSREAEAVILYADTPAKFLERACKTCNRLFAVNRSHIAFCGDDCRSVYINDVLGLEWDPTGRSPEERWSAQTGGSEPLIVPPTALTLLKQRPVAPTEDDFLELSPEIAELLGEGSH